PDSAGGPEEKSRTGSAAGRKRFRNGLRRNGRAAECLLPRCRDESHVEPVGGVPGKFFGEYESDKRDSPGRPVSHGQTRLGSATKSATANSIAASLRADSGSGHHRRPQPGSNQCVARRPVTTVAANVRRRKPFTKPKPSASLRRRLQITSGTPRASRRPR